jgi:predicted amidohydrolase YtcJ
MTVRSIAALCRAFLVVTNAIVLAFLSPFALGTPAEAGSDPRLVNGAADMVLLAGKIITVAQDNSIAQAAALKHGRIVAVGDDAAIRKLIGPKTQVIELHGKAVLPGLIDAHTHIEGIADYHRMLDLHIPPLKDVDEMLTKIKERAENTPKGEWIVGAGGWGQPMPTRAQLDSVTRDHPVLVRESAHEIIVNTKALELAHIDENTPDPVGSKIWRDPQTGEPTGRLSEMFGRMLVLIPKPSYEMREQSVKEVLEGFARNGVTTIYDFPSPDGLRMYQDLLARGELPVRLRCQPILNVAGDRDPDSTFGEDFLSYGIRTGFGNDWLRVGGIKLFLDGESETGLRYNPPGQKEKWVGVQKMDQETLNRVVVEAQKNGFQIWIHALGNRAQDMALEAYELAQREYPRADARNRIEHAGNQEAGATSQEQLDRMKRLGIIPVPTGAWIYLGRAYKGTQAEVPFIYRTLLDQGFEPPGNSDSLGSMPESMNPFFSMWAMVTRKTRSGELLAPEQAITPAEAIRIYTMFGAHSGFEEKNKGSIEIGKLADLIIVSDDPLTVPPDKLKEIKVLTTIIDGKIVISADGNQ